MEEHILKTQIDPAFKKRLLFRGTFLAFLGCFPILIAGTFFSIDLLTTTGFPILMIGLLLIRKGMAPYQKVSQQELKPNELIINHKMLIYKIEGKNVFSIPISCIASLSFKEQKSIYGIEMKLNVPFSEKIMLHNPVFNVRKFHDKAKKKWDCDFFFPFFYETSFHSLKNFEPLTERNILQEKL